MQLIRGLPDPDRFPHGCVVTIGNFDGVHLGHQAVLRQAAALAESGSLPLVVMTFEPLPREFFRPDAPVARLTRLRERVCFIRELGAERPIAEALIVLPFTRRLADMPAEDFVRHIFVETLKARQVVIGDDFRFGHGRQGDFALLERMGAQSGFGVQAADTMQVDGERVSSTRIRAHLAERDVAGAARLLGRPVTLCGRVTHGDKRGRQLGFPTANVALNRRLSPLRGVFVVDAELPDGSIHSGVANVGTRPTVSGGDARLEVHLFDFDRDIYGQILRVRFLHPLRDERKFDSLADLVAQIQLDEQSARAWLAPRPGD
ncbi:riboflavin biosynthesis protein RibF [Halothiobacillus diazotrophicus]|uniref:Riboflavin biosynthesis protein n=1 Tax=Halothiobacillus diazotrophicus TaxID=1860122 RepID=A0A191ZHL0_9GAMM|nr:bifunctional riboflavin kinase/FAD synthetase [Halothiobacillus diazotrophicus]ANJ67350.1 riboflavin biosynthesis protein RibF [Halothiobacillus diazotrophicus]